MSNSIGIYIHIPFCRGKCPYCDFFSTRGNQDEYKAFANSLKDEINFWGKKINADVDTVYFGGGTPSVIGSDLICDILKGIKSNFNVVKNAEITMEANPASGKFFDFTSAHNLGLNRVSLGMQSVNENELKKLGRLHSVDDVGGTIKLIKAAGINNISLDVMLGIPEQNLNSLKNTLDFCIKSDIKHISSYILKIEKNTFYGKNKNKYNFPNDELTSDLYLYTVDYLSKNGFNQYELSNFSVHGYESKHNLKYWNLDEYIGIGPAAHSLYHGKRFYYENSIDNFKNNIIEDGLGGTKEEYIMLKLRLEEGLNINEYKKAFGENLPKDFFEKVNLYSKSGFLNYENNVINFTPKGFLVSNSILADLI